jgi:hypothetical protein
MPVSILKIFFTIVTITVSLVIARHVYPCIIFKGRNVWQLQADVDSYNSKKKF